MEEKIMGKRITLTAVSAVLALVLTFSAFAVCFYAVGVYGTKNSTLPEVGSNGPLAAAPILGGDSKINGFEIADLSDKEYLTYGDVTLKTEGGVLKEYSVGGKTVTLYTTLGTGILDTVFVDGVAVANVYTDSDNYTDMLTFGDNTVTVMESDESSAALLINDALMLYEYGADGRLERVSLSDKTMREYTYDAQGNVVSFTDSLGKTTTYSYEDGRLANAGGNTVGNEGGLITVTVGYDRYAFEFAHKYNGTSYLTSVTKNGAAFASYTYINDAVLSSEVNGVRTDYILDSSLNAVGMLFEGELFSFVYDRSGALFCILDGEGTMITRYEQGVFGISGVADPYRLGNSVVGRGVIYLADIGATVLNGEVILADKGVKATASGAVSLGTQDRLALLALPGVYDAHGAIDIDTALRTKVAEEVLLTLESNGYAAAASLFVNDEYGRAVGNADIFLLPTECAGESIKNAMSGNRLFTIIKNGESRADARARLTEICDEDSKLYVNYFDDYKPAVADLSFEGQFVYLGCLVNYSASDGIITYGTYENIMSNYDTYGNVYDYDKGAYAMYVSDSFSLDEWDYTAIIPGANRETYDVVEQYINDAIEVSNATSFENVEYLDRGYYDSYVNSANGDTLDLLVDLDPAAMVTLADDGEIRIEAVPFWERTDVRKEVCRTVAKAVVVTAVAAVVSVYCPAAGGAVFAVFKTAVFTGLTSMIFTTVVTFGIDLYKTQIAGQELNETIDELAFRYLTGAVNAYTNGVITGTIAGVLRYMPKSAGKATTVVKGSSTSGKVQYKLDALHKEYAYIMDDSMAARMEYERLCMQIQTNALRGEKSVEMLKNAYYALGIDTKLIGVSVKGVQKSNELLEMTMKGELK